MPMTTLHLPDSVNLATTTRALGVGDWDGESWWWSTETAAGTGTIRISTAGPASVVASSWGDGSEILLDRLPHLVGLHDTGFATTPPAIRDLVGHSRGLRIGSNRAMYETVATTVVGQLVTTKEAKASLRRLVETIGRTAPGPRRGKHAFPGSPTIASLSYQELHRFGFERKRASTLIEVARRAARLEEALTMDIPSANERLLAVRGVGVWTAGNAMGQAYGDTDAVPIGDFHLPNSVAWALAGEDRADDERMLELLEPYRPHRRRVILMIKYAGISAPKYGPKSAVRRHL
jgi:3-methyladenine DNA glycosylase/8-oxoguanine DNA glycosylase